eukprot:CAMPEP_0201122366 /NCGR_PEP_ID=MMETSP0850-20130426/6026_1 /ASSEMBLY_ACC=CAM_ASM_000622 /TAXON_ID=183588 /ORGANISM="Pseudo-nitzschia fraudulenta, Strain WWA7" /LENGTH=432 /DNA_ID=CAMNT_0047389045 /DNA_START=87 /DNA_END=1385 /DNA_ORIENTATION=-
METQQQTTPNEHEEHFETETTEAREAGRQEHQRQHDETMMPPATFESPPTLPVKTRTGGSRRPNRRFLSQQKQGSSAFSFSFLFLFLLVSCLGLARAAAEFPKIGRDVDAETGRKCVDKEPKNCPFWAANGECEANRSYMHVNCKRSCNRCHVVRVQDADGIHSFLAQKKKEHDERKREEQREEAEVLEFLKRVGISGEESERRKREEENRVVRGDDSQSKGLPEDGGDHDKNGGGVAIEGSGGAATAEINGNGGAVIGNSHDLRVVVADTTSNATIETGDPSSAGGSYSKQSTTEKERRTEEESKPRTKKTTTTTRGSSGSSNEEKPKIDVETGSECVDQNKNCPFWAEKGECKANRTYMNANCRLSCNRCHIVRVNSEREMQRYIAQKTQGRKTVTREEREERKVMKVLEGGTITSGNERDSSYRGHDEL